MEPKKTNQKPTKVSVNTSLTQYEELSELELETVSGGKGGRGGRGTTLPVAIVVVPLK